MNFSDVYKSDARAEDRKAQLVERARELLRVLKRLMITNNVDMRWAKLTVRIAVRDLENEFALDPEYIAELINDLHRAVRALARALDHHQRQVVLEITTLLQALVMQRIKERAAHRVVCVERRRSPTLALLSMAELRL